MYRHMLERYKQTLPERPKSVRKNAALPFAIDELRALAKSKMGEECRYCHEKLTPRIMSIDHRKPVARGGSWRMGNIQVICASCNTAKGNMTGKEFARLYRVLSTFDPTAKRQLLGRIKAGAAMYKRRFLSRR